MQNTVMLITGPIGSGKSTLSRQLAKRRKQCADIDIEAINYMIVNGFSFNPDAEYDQQITFNEWAISGDTIGSLAKHFLESNYDVIIHGRVNDELLYAIESHLLITYKVLLLPAIDEVISRDLNRGSHMSIGESAVRKDFEYYSQQSWNGFVRVDTSEEDIEQSMQKFHKILLDQ